MLNLILKPGRDRVVRQHHPWLFSGAIDRIDNDAKDGAIVDVVSAKDEWLARGYLNRRSQIVARLLSWDRHEEIERAFWRGRLERAITGRLDLKNDPGTTAYRVVNAESDGLPGLIVDRYGDWLVVQVLTLGMEQRKDELVDLLRELSEGVRGIYERSDVDVREKEGLALITGRLWGEEPDDRMEVLENGYRFVVDVKQGHKTGFYLDQRENRDRVRPFCAGAEVLNAFSYTGAFGVYALSGGATSVVNIDTSGQALELAMCHVALNQLVGSDVAFEEGDVFSRLRAYRAVGRQFDLIVLDPPRFALSRSHLRRAARGYKDINWIAFQILRQGGVLFTFSCSGLVSRELFQKIISGAALDAQRDVQIIGSMSQASDHPISVNFPEAAYLKGLICRVW